MPKNLKWKLIYTFCAIYVPVLIYAGYKGFPGRYRICRDGFYSGYTGVATSGYQNLITTVCWLFGSAYIIKALVKFAQKSYRKKQPYETETHLVAIAFSFLSSGIYIFCFPFIQSTISGRIGGPPPSTVLLLAAECVLAGSIILPWIATWKLTGFQSARKGFFRFFACIFGVIFILAIPIVVYFTSTSYAQEHCRR